MSTDGDYLINSTHHARYNTVGENRPDSTIPKKLPQYIATITATLSALASGIVLGWTSPIVTELENGSYHDITVTNGEMGWIGSLTTIGALVTCIPTGFICDIIGRRTTLLSLFIPFGIGWALLIFAQSILFIYLGRFILGIATGACCIAAPLYISEIAHKDIRGNLGSYFQLMVTIGILYAYTFGAFLNPTNYTIVCSLIPLLFVVLFAFQPESPLFYAKNSKFEAAEAAMKRLRGCEYNIGPEMLELEVTLREGLANVGLMRSFQKKACKKGMLISLSLMFFQQMSGINAVIFYTSDIFEDARVQLNAEYASIIVGVCQVVATFISSLIVDRLGRRLLLTISAFLMSFSMLLLGVFFLLKDHNLVSSLCVANLSFLPILALTMYIIVFSLGLGPIPWIISGEIFSPEIKSVASSISGTFNWFLAFLVTKLFLQIAKQIGNDMMFFFFSFVLLFASVYINYTLLETKGKSIVQIQSELET